MIVSAPVSALLLVAATGVPETAVVAQPVVAQAEPADGRLIVPAEVPAPAPGATDPARPAAGLDQDVDAITVSARVPVTPGDPLERINAKSYEVVQGVDRAFVGPVAMAYKKVLPNPLRSGLHNVLKNLDEPVVFVNFLLQLKPVSALKTAGRFAVNSTIGIAGLVDVAKRKPFHLPYRPNGFADTMGYYGVKPGPYMFLPLIGPTTMRDLLGLWLDRGMVPALAGRPFNRPPYAIGASVVRALDYRVEFDDTLRQLHSGNDDPYAATRAYYLATRQAEIDGLHGKKPAVVPVLQDKVPEAAAQPAADPVPASDPPPAPEGRVPAAPLP